MTVSVGITELMRDSIRERASVGRIVDQQHGIRFGRPKKINDELKLLVKQLLEDKQVREIVKKFNIHKAIIYCLLE